MPGTPGGDASSQTAGVRVEIAPEQAEAASTDATPDGNDERWLALKLLAGKQTQRRYAPATAAARRSGASQATAPREESPARDLPIRRPPDHHPRFSSVSQGRFISLSQRFICLSSDTTRSS